MTQLTVSIEDVSMLDQIKQAISLIRGVSSVTLKRRRKTSMDRAIEDIEQGRVYKYDSLDDLIKEIEVTAKGSGNATSSPTGSLFGSRTKQNSFLYW